MSIACSKRGATQVGNNALLDVWFFGSDGKAQTKEKYTINAKGAVVSTLVGKRYAKVEFYEDRKVYYIKTYRAGARHGQVVADPNSLLGSEQDLSNNNDLYGSRICEYFKVGEKTFYDYVDYLVTKNPARLRFVERSVLDGES